MPSSPRAWPSAARAALAVGVVVASFVLLLWAKREFLGAYLAARPWSDVAWLLLLAGAAWGAGRWLGATRGVAWTAGLPLLAVLFVLVMSTPMPYELAHHARSLPHPGGTARPEALETSPFFERQHPVATVIFRYAPDRDLRGLTSETAEAYRAAGWTLTSLRLPEGSGPGEFGYVAATRGDFAVSCTLGERSDFVDWDGPMRTLGCRLTV